MDKNSLPLSIKVATGMLSVSHHKLRRRQLITARHTLFAAEPGVVHSISTCCLYPVYQHVLQFAVSSPFSHASGIDDSVICEEGNVAVADPCWKEVPK